VTAVTNPRDWADDQRSGEGDMDQQEKAMTASVKMRKARWRMTRWFKQFRDKNRPPYRWYEHDSVGMH
jgi:hypothetical protein